MSSPLLVAAIAKDEALLRSLVFAMEAHGFRVEQFQSWEAAKERCAEVEVLVLDSSLPAADIQACLTLATCKKVILLAEGDMHEAPQLDLRVVQKPLSGPDVIAALIGLRKDP